MGDDVVTIGVNAPLVVSETRDGEAIVMHHGTGTFFDADGSGAFIWQMIERGTTEAAAADAVRTAYGIDNGTAALAVADFLALLRQHDLVTIGETGDSGTSIGADAVDVAAAGPFTPPALRVHTDLADMLLLDPIHDVDEAGWPLAANG